MADQQHSPPNGEGDRFDGGFIKTWRSIRHDPIYKDSLAYHLFQHCVMSASYRDKTELIYGQKVFLSKGQFVAGLHKLVSQTGIPINRVRHRLALLEKLGKITRKTTNKFSIITVCNYEYYQATEGSKPQAKPQTDHKQTTTTKNIKEEKHYVEDSVELQLASLLLEEIRKNKSDFKQPRLRSWAGDIDFMIRQDGRRPERIREVILWCQHDSFWWKNTLSTGKLREKFDRLEAEMKGEKAKAASKAHHRPRMEYKDLTGEGRL